MVAGPAPALARRSRSTYAVASGPCDREARSMTCANARADALGLPLLVVCGSAVDPLRRALIVPPLAGMASLQANAAAAEGGAAVAFDYSTRNNPCGRSGTRRAEQDGWSMAYQLTALGISVLALLRQRPMHGYEMLQTLVRRQADRIVKLRPGSLYHVVDRLTEEKLVRRAATTRAGNRPERAVYEITDAGAEALGERVR